MTEDKRIEWCKKHCVDHAGTTYVRNLSFNDQKFIEIDTKIYANLCLIFNETKLPEFIKFKVKEPCFKKVHINLEKCLHLKSWEGLPTEKINQLWLGSEIEDIDYMPVCGFIDHSFIENKEEKHRANKKLRIKLWQKFKSEVLNKLQELNPEINIFDYEDAIEWLSIHDKSFYSNFKNYDCSNQKILINDFFVFESIGTIPPLQIKSKSRNSRIYLLPDFDLSLSRKLVNNISLISSFIYFKNKTFSEEEFLMFSENQLKNQSIQHLSIQKTLKIKK